MVGSRDRGGGVNWQKQWGHPKVRAKSLRARFAAAYQLAGGVVWSDDLTEGQKQRLDTLLLDVLSEPERYTAKIIARLMRDAVRT
jgi:hypothetical protein